MLDKIRKLFSYLFYEPKSLLTIILYKLSPLIPDKPFLIIKYYLMMGKMLHIDNPQTYNEKLQWLKIYNRNSDYTRMVDKATAKDFVTSIIGKDYIIPTLGIWNSVEDIDWNMLPQRFVIKSTGDSGGVLVCKDKRKLNIREAIVKLKKEGSRNYYSTNREYPYKDVPHRYIAEEYMEDESGYELKDYKFFCFDGVPRFLFVATGRQQHDTRFDFYDTNFNHLPVINGHPNADEWPTKPKNFDEMLSIASKLSKGITHVRVDLYNINGKIYFGEMTFFHWSGMVPFEPESWDYIFGDYIHLPN